MGDEERMSLDSDEGREAFAEWQADRERCTCGSEGPDYFGNYDQIEDDACPIHGADPDQERARAAYIAENPDALRDRDRPGK